MATKHFATDPNGKVHTRTSQNRKYEFCVIVRDGYEQALERARSTRGDKQLERNYDYYVALAAGTHEHCKFRDAERLIAEAKAKIAGTSTFAQYSARLTAQAVAAVEKAKLAGKYDSYGVYGWCGRRDLAEKLAAQVRKINHFDQIIIAEVTTA